MNLYIFEGVLTDYTDGLAVIAAEDLSKAQALAYEEFRYRSENLQGFLDRDPGFLEPAGVYPSSVVQAGVLHFVRGGS